MEGGKGEGEREGREREGRGREREGRGREGGGRGRERGGREEKGGREGERRGREEGGRKEGERGGRKGERKEGEKGRIYSLSSLNAGCGIMGPTGATDMEGATEDATEATTEGAERMFAIPSLVLLVALLSTLH